METDLKSFFFCVWHSRIEKENMGILCKVTHPFKNNYKHLKNTKKNCYGGDRLWHGLSCWCNVHFFSSLYISCMCFIFHSISFSISALELGIFFCFCIISGEEINVPDKACLDWEGHSWAWPKKVRRNEANDQHPLIHSYASCGTKVERISST